MDTILDKLLETIKEKMSKKQVIAIVAIIVLYMLTAHPGYITGIAIIAILVQAYLDKGENHEKADANNSAGDSSTGGLPIHSKR